METAHDLSPLSVRLVQLMQIVMSSHGGLKPRLPALPTHFSTQVRYILMDREKQQGWKLNFSIARQDLNELDFSDMLMEDQDNDAMSYVDCKCSLHPL